MGTPVRAVMFDAVGTLVHTDPPAVQVYLEIGRQFGSSLSRETIAARFRETFAKHQGAGEATDEATEQRRWQTIVAEVFPEVTDGQGLFQALWDHFARPENWAPFDDVQATWTALHQQGLTIGVASNFDIRLQEISRHHHPLTECKQVFWSAQLGYSKPNVEFFRRIERHMQLASKEILLVGDDPVNDYQGAKAAGWHAIRVDRSQHETGDEVIHRLGELLTRNELDFS